MFVESFSLLKQTSVHDFRKQSQRLNGHRDLGIESKGFSITGSRFTWWTWKNLSELITFIFIHFVLGTLHDCGLGCFEVFFFKPTKDWYDKYKSIIILEFVFPSKHYLQFERRQFAFMCEQRGYVVVMDVLNISIFNRDDDDEKKNKTRGIIYFF